MNKNELPDGWEILPFEKCLCKVAQKNTKKYKVTEYLKSGDYPIIDQGQTQIAGFTNDENEVLDFGQPVVIFGDHTLNVKYIDFPFARGADGTQIIIPNIDLIYPKYFFYVIQNLDIKINNYERYFKYVKKSNFIIPPLPEQEKIVSKLDEQVAQIEIMKTEAKKQKEILSSLFLSYLSEKFDEKFPKEQLGSLVHEIKNGIYKPSLFRERGHKLVRMYNIENDSIELNDNDLELIELTDDEIEKYTLRRDDIIISRVNSSELVGKCGIVKDKLIGYAFENMVIRVRVDHEKIIPDYLAYFLISPKGREEIKSRARHAINQSSINNDDLSNILVSLPPNIDIQKEIVNELNSKFELVRELKKQIEIELNAIESLQSSILSKVFSKYEIPDEA